MIFTCYPIIKQALASALRDLRDAGDESSVYALLCNRAMLCDKGVSTGKYFRTSRFFITLGFVENLAANLNFLKRA